MPLADFFLKLHYYYKNKEQEYRERAELVRLQTLTLVNIQLARKDKIKDAKQLWRFAWEQESGGSGKACSSLFDVAKKMKEQGNERNQ